MAFNPPEKLRECYTRIGELASTTRRDNPRTFPEFDSLDAVPSHGVSVGLYDHAQVRVWADAAAATGNAVYPLAVPHQIATEQNE